MKILFALTFVLLSVLTLKAQEEDKIDSSKPTNFYSMLDNTLELSNRPNENVFGYRGKLMLAPSEAHLILAEIPLMHNSRTSKTGLGDIRARYFFLPYKNYEKLIGAFGPSVDVFIPTGSFENGLGSGRMVISPGVTVGIMASEVIQFFPILSYQYMGKPTYDNPAPETDKSINGFSFQVITPIVFSDKFFMQVTPIFRMNNLEESNTARYVQELFGSYVLAEKLQLTGFYSGNFEDEIHTFSLGLTVFL